MVHYSMIIWNCQKVNYSNSALKPLPRLPNVPKVAYVWPIWDILIFQAFGTIRFTGVSHGAYLQLEQWAILKDFYGNSYPLTLKMFNERKRVVRAIPGGHEK